MPSATNKPFVPSLSPRACPREGRTREPRRSLSRWDMTGPKRRGRTNHLWWIDRTKWQQQNPGASGRNPGCKFRQRERSSHPVANVSGVIVPLSLRSEHEGCVTSSETIGEATGVGLRRSSGGGQRAEGPLVIQIDAGDEGRNAGSSEQNNNELLHLRT